jgi:transposase
MFIRKTTKTVKDKTYENYVLLETVYTPQGPRQKTVCSLGSLSPGPKEEWLAVAKKLEASLAGQMTFEGDDETVKVIVEQIRRKRGRPPRVPPVEPPPGDGMVIPVVVDKVRTEDHREAGPSHVGVQFWNKLAIDSVLEELGFSEKARTLTLLMTMNRLISPSSEYAMPDWIGRSALSDILGKECTVDNDDMLYRHLDLLHTHRKKIEGELWERSRTLFNLDNTIFLYDCTSTYFEGQCPLNPKAQRGYSRDGRPDCKQVVIGLVVNRDGFPIAHEVFEGNRSDVKTVEDMLDAIENRCGKKTGAMIVVDRGMVSPETITMIKDRGYHYLVATRKGERDQWLDEFESIDGWRRVDRKSSPRNPSQKKSVVWVKPVEGKDDHYVLCISDNRVEKDCAIREKQEKHFLAALEKLRLSAVRGAVKEESKVHERLGRLKERYSRVARYYEISYDEKTRDVQWTERTDKKEVAETLDGSYVLRTDRSDLCEKDIWLIYSLLTRAESAFRSMKSPLSERPIFHHLTHRVEAHIFLCVLAYHLMVAVEKTLLDKGVHTSWPTVRDTLSTHQVCTVVLETPEGRVLEVRNGSTPEPVHKELYELLGIPSKVMKPVKRWVDRKPHGISDETNTTIQ